MIWFLLVVIAVLVYLLRNEMKVVQRKGEESKHYYDLWQQSQMLASRRGRMITLYESGFTKEMVNAHFEEVDRRMAQDADK